ncbi:hypothetical protein [Arcobacter vandammei]|uniref:hypothetical protein n=1 Tax=Arcobacter vandammei TaxID=2782243 RepID=UPI0018DEFC6F|nr:hypothetical protein [Arcobacter vandammei]
MLKLLYFDKEKDIKAYTIFSISSIFSLLIFIIFLLFFYKTQNQNSKEISKYSNISNFAYSTKNYEERFKDYITVQKDLNNLNFKSSYLDFVYEK